MFWPRNFAKIFWNFTFEIIDYFRCRSNGSSRPQLNQMLEFSLKTQGSQVPRRTRYYQGLSQDLETGCPKLVVVKFLGVQIFEGDNNILRFQP